MIIQFINSTTSGDRPKRDLYGSVFRVNTEEIINDGGLICRPTDLFAFALVAMNVSWHTGELSVSNGYACPCLTRFAPRIKIIALGSYYDKLEFSDNSLRQLGLAGKLLADQMLPALLMTEKKLKKPDALYSGEYWDDSRNWRVRYEQPA